MESNNNNNITETDQEVDSILTETRRLTILVNNIEDQTEREIQRLGKVLDTFAKESGNQKYDFNFDGKTNRFYSNHIRNKLKQINAFRKKYFSRRNTYGEQRHYLLESELSQSVSELQDLARVAMTVNETETETSILLSSETSDGELDCTPESIISDTTIRGNSGYGSHARYKLMKYFTSDRQDGLTYKKQNEDLCPPYISYTKRDRMN